MAIFKIALITMVMLVIFMDKSLKVRWMAEGVYFFSCFFMIYSYESHGLYLDFSVFSVFAILVCSGFLSHAWLKLYGIFPHGLLIGYLLCFCGFHSIVNSQDLTGMYVGVELVSYALLLCILLRPKDAITLEAAFKYLVFQMLGSLSLLMAMYLMTELGQSLQILDIVKTLAQPSQDPLASIMLALWALGMATKMGCAPMHSYVADVYEASSPVVLGMLGLLPRFSMWVMVWRLLPIVQVNSSLWMMLCAWLAVSSWFMGHMNAVGQTRLMRMMGYASTAQMGWMWLAWSVGSVDALIVSFNFLWVYSLAWMVFICLISHLLYNQREVWWLDELSGLMLVPAHKQIASLLVLAMMVMMGMPPFIGFWMKFSILRLSTLPFFQLLSILGVMGSVVGCVYYVKIIYHAIVRAHCYGVTLLNMRGVVLGLLSGSVLFVLSVMPAYIIFQ